MKSHRHNILTVADTGISTLGFENGYEGMDFQSAT
jgi:hypothetical protein